MRKSHVTLHASNKFTVFYRCYVFITSCSGSQSSYVTSKGKGNESKRGNDSSIYSPEISNRSSLDCKSLVGIICFNAKWGQLIAIIICGCGLIGITGKVVNKRM